MICLVGPARALNPWHWVWLSALKHCKPLYTGVGTLRWPMDTYLSTFGIAHFTLVLIVYANGPPNDRVRTFITELDRHRVRYIVIRTKVDNNIKEALRLKWEDSEGEEPDEIELHGYSKSDAGRQVCNEWLLKAKEADARELPPSAEVFMVCNNENAKRTFPQLKREYDNFFQALINALAEAAVRGTQSQGAPIEEDAATQLLTMGFNDEAKNRQALEQAGNLQDAIDILIASREDDE